MAISTGTFKEHEHICKKLVWHTSVTHSLIMSEIAHLLQNLLRVFFFFFQWVLILEAYFIKTITQISLGEEF